MLTKFLVYFLLLICITPAVGWFWFTKEPEPVKEEPKVQAKTVTLMIYPADSPTPRQIEDALERTITLACAQEIKGMLENRMPHVQVVLTRTQGEIVEPLQCASLANRFKVDFYLSLHFYKNTEKTHKLHIYYILYNGTTDFWQTKDSELSFTPYSKAYKTHIKKTQAWAQCMVDRLKGSASFSYQGLFGLPFKPLMGVCAPALGIECGIRRKDDYKLFVEPLVEALIDSIKHFEPEKKNDLSTQATPLPVFVN